MVGRGRAARARRTRWGAGAAGRNLAGFLRMRGGRPYGSARSLPAARSSRATKPPPSRSIPSRFSGLTVSKRTSRLGPGREEDGRSEMGGGRGLHKRHDLASEVDRSRARYPGPITRGRLTFVYVISLPWALAPRPIARDPHQVARTSSKNWRARPATGWATCKHRSSSSFPPGARPSTRGSHRRGTWPRWPPARGQPHQASPSFAAHRRRRK